MSGTRPGTYSGLNIITVFSVARANAAARKADLHLAQHGTVIPADHIVNAQANDNQRLRKCGARKGERTML